MIISCDAFELDPSERELRRDGEAVAFEPKVFDLIAFLIEHRDKVVSKRELIDALWQGRFVSEASLSTAVKSARRALGDSEQTQCFIKIVHGMGFRFVGDLAPRMPALAPAEPTARTPVADLAEPAHGGGQPSIAVLRLSNVGTSDAGDLLAQALPAELISGLSRMKWLQVIARGSSFRFDPRSFDPNDVARRLGVGYILSGIMEPVGASVRVSLELQSTADGTLI